MDIVSTECTATVTVYILTPLSLGPGKTHIHNLLGCIGPCLISFLEAQKKGGSGGGREGGRDGEWKGGKEGVKGGREGRREGGRDGWRKGGCERREGGREGVKDGGKEEEKVRKGGGGRE